MTLREWDSRRGKRRVARALLGGLLPGGHSPEYFPSQVAFHIDRPEPGTRRMPMVSFCSICGAIQGAPGQVSRLRRFGITHGEGSSPSWDCDPEADEIVSMRFSDEANQLFSVNGYDVHAAVPLIGWAVHAEGNPFAVGGPRQRPNRVIGV
jgi:hypothetical protein